MYCPMPNLIAILNTTHSSKGQIQHIPVLDSTPLLYWCKLFVLRGEGSLSTTDKTINKTPELIISSWSLPHLHQQVYPMYTQPWPETMLVLSRSVNRLNYSVKDENARIPNVMRPELVQKSINSTNLALMYKLMWQQLMCQICCFVRSSRFYSRG